MLYQEAARIIQHVTRKEGSVKSLLHTSKYKNIKQLYALVCETLKYRNIITEILDATNFMQFERKRVKSEELATVLLYEHLFGKGLLGGTAKPLKDAIARHKSALSSQLVRIKVRRKVSRNEDLLEEAVQQEALPRYVRVNYLATTVDAVCQYFTAHGYSKLDASKLSYSQYVELVRTMKNKCFVCDPHLDDLLTFHPGCDLHDHPLYLNGHIILQDKASCIPASCLNPPAGGHVIDACAAPGNKTSHVASIMRNTGKVFAFDLDPKRAATMKQLLRKAKVTCAEVKVTDALKVKPDDPQYSEVEYAIVDPSCSGSGIVSRLNHLTDEAKESKERLAKLSAFQVAILKHILSFPNMKKVVYSTCSVHEEENERVVQDVLQGCGNQYQLECVMPSLPSRGVSVFPGAENTLRLSPHTDATNGFFVACFVKKTSQSEPSTCGRKSTQTVSDQNPVKEEQSLCPQKKKQALLTASSAAKKHKKKKKTLTEL